MNFRTTLAISVAIMVLLTVIESGGAHRIYYSMQHYNQTVPIEEKNYFLCYCNGETRSAKLGMHSLDKVLQGLQNQEFCAEEKPQSRYCDWLDECQNCTGVFETCTAMPCSGRGYNCTIVTFGKREKLLMNSNGTFGMREKLLMNSNGTFGMREKLLMNSNGTFGEFDLKHRKRRRALACYYGDAEVKTSSLTTVKYPSSVLAWQKCVFGYTLKEGISREMRCLYSENEWKPVGFGKCRPFIDCSLKMISGGSSKCTLANVNRAPACEITCYAFEDKKSTEKSTYKCNIHGGWEPELPHCATAGTGIKLVPAPEILLHPTEEESKEDLE